MNMKKIWICLLTIGMLFVFCACGTGEDEFSDKYLVGNIASASGFEDFDFWESLPQEYRICYDGTVEIYMPTLSEHEITGYEMAGTYQLTVSETDDLRKIINQKKLLKLDPKEDYAVCDGSSRTLTLYGKNDEVLKKCGGYMPRNKDFVSMYSAVKDTLHWEEHARIREAWISKLKEEAGEN